MSHWDIIHPRRRFVALHLYLDSKLRSLTAQIVTFRKRLFRDLPYKRLKPHSIDVVLTRPAPLWNWLVWYAKL